MAVDRLRLLADLERLTNAHGPSGTEGEVERLLLEMFAGLGDGTWQDDADSIVVHFKGRSSDRGIAVVAHKDEIAMIVKRVDADGRIRVRPVGGLHPWAIGESPVEILVGEQSLPGVLSIGSKHVSVESPAAAPKEGGALTWEAMWVETKLDAATLASRGVRPGRRVVIARHRKAPWWLGHDFLCGYNLDCRAGLAMLVAAAHEMAVTPPAVDTWLIASSEEEIGGLGAVWSVGQVPASTVVALDVVPVAGEYQTQNSADPILPCKDRAGLYHAATVDHLTELASQLGFGVQTAVLTSYASDATLSKAAASAARAVLIGYPGDNTHGFEISHVDGIVNCARLLVAYLGNPQV
ncbi:MAG: M42 family peptidase [bacterium]|nr:M42 family peptidase [bacterium]